jgi:hypothetical protein
MADRMEYKGITLDIPYLEKLLKQKLPNQFSERNWY